jgi:hypothetical protein
MRVLAGLIVALTLTGTAGAQPQPEQKKKDGERMICRPVEQTGSRVSRQKICKTQDEWRAQEEFSRKNLEDSQREVNRY